MNIAESDESWLIQPEVTSTQAVLAQLLAANSPVRIVVAEQQSEGKGRFDRTWQSPKGSLAMSIAFDAYSNFKKPWLIGMACACAAAGVLHCRLQWPNDLVLESKKLGGVLTEVIQGIPIVGIGVNLSIEHFSREVESIAISLHQYRALVPDAVSCAKEIVARIRSFPDPESWTDLEPIWNLFDSTAGKIYRLSDGNQATAIGIGPEGELIASLQGETISVVAADAILGNS